MKRTLLAAAVLVATQAACMGSPSLVKERPAAYLEANAPGQVWATLNDGNKVIIDGPRVISDTIFGWAEGEEFVLPVDEVKEVRVRQLSIWRSAMIPAAVVGLGIGGIFLVNAPQGDAIADVTQNCEDTGGICDATDPDNLPE